MIVSDIRKDIRKFREFTLEDLRRSFMSRADALGISEDVIDRLVGHTTFLGFARKVFFNKVKKRQTKKKVYSTKK